MKTKLCRICKAKFEPHRALQSCCSFECEVKRGIEIANKSRLNADKQRLKAERIERRELKLKTKTRAKWLKEAQVIFNRFIRLRDDVLPCISCGRHHQGQYHAGHYRTVGACPSLRFAELNCHKQCSACNNYLSGNIVMYRKALLIKIGEVQLDWLEGEHEPQKWTIPELQDLIKRYKAKINALSDA